MENDGSSVLNGEPRKRLKGMRYILRNMILSVSYNEASERR